MPPPSHPPRSILILGTGVFGLSIALSLSLRPPPSCSIVLVDRHAFPVPDSSSIDTSRIIRADYADPLYARLALRAQRIWRGDEPDNLLHGIGDGGRYTQNGLVLACSEDGKGEGGVEYVKRSYENMKRMLGENGNRDGGGQVEWLQGEEDMKRVMKGGEGRVPGTCGYINRTSGWANAEQAMRFVHSKLPSHVRTVVGEVSHLLEEGTVVKGVVLKSGRSILADVTILATGAWTPGLLDMRGRAVATGQSLGYYQLKPHEWESVKEMPVFFNTSDGVLMIPQSDGVLKMGLHTLGYTNPQPSPHSTTTTVSLPRTALTHPGTSAPPAAQVTMLSAVAVAVPQFFDNRGLSGSRLCWYTDTPTGDFIVDWHPEKKGLFVATGGSGHGFKFLPVLGEEIVNVFEGKETECARKWRWPEEKGEREVMCGDGSRGGERGELLVFGGEAKAKL